MPFYYDFSQVITTDATTDTISEDLLVLTGAAGTRNAKIMGLYAGGREGTAGGGNLRLVTCATAGSGGSAATENPRHPDTPVADTIVTTGAFTPGTTLSTRVAIGWAQTGGMGGWVALDLDHALHLMNGAAATGNAEVHSIANGTSQVVEMTIEWAEN